MTSAQQYIARLTALATAARHHPEPAVAVSLLAQLLLDFVAELQPLVQKYGLLLKAGGAAALFEQLEADLAAAELELAATALPGAQAGTYQDLQPDAGTVAGEPGHDPNQDTTGTAG